MELMDENFIDEDIFDNHNNIMNKFTNMRKMTTDEKVYMRNLEVQNNPIVDDSALNFDT